MSRDSEFEFTPPSVPDDPSGGPLSPDQLGYQPSIYNSKFSRRNSLPQPFLTHSPLLGSPQLGAHSPHSPHSFDQQSNSLHGSPKMILNESSPINLPRNRRASLPTLSVSSTTSTTAPLLHPSSPAHQFMADIKPQTRSSVIQLNPAYLTQSGREQDTAPVTGDGSEGSDSEDEIVNVDEPDEMETETVPLTQAERLAENLRTQNSPEKKINSETSSATPPFGEKRRSPKARFEPYRKEKNEIDENENRTSKSNKNTALQSVVEEIKKQAAMMAQKPISRSGTGSISASGFLPAQVCKLVLSSTTNSNEVAPNAVIQLNKNNNRNEEQASTEECQNRPFKCHLCNVGFRISGHLSRHYKSRAHINQMQKRPDSAMLFAATPEPTKVFEKVFEVQDGPIDLSINAKKVQANPSPPDTPPKPVFKAIKLGKSVSPTTIDPSRLIKPVNRISPNSDSISGSPIASQQVISGTPTTSIKAISPSSLPKLKEPRPTEVISGQPQSSTSEVTENGTRRFRCDICDIGFRFQGHLDRHLRSTTHMSMEEAVRRTGRRPNAE